ncbi:MAG: hypothetical protein HC892_07105 [Saprospiraceae bacterium]|nr:hypothetical protein [Saprospiraceae bacterium]
MQLNKIQEFIAQYKICLEKDTEFQQRNLYKWESLKIWKDNWDTEALNFQKMFDTSLQNSITRRIWSREYYAPKQMMLIFIGLQPEFVRLMFRELFNEDKAMEYRADRFVFYCDTLMEAYKEQQKKPIEQTHFHEGYEMISYYLSFQFPEHYNPYYFTNFQKPCP